MGRTTKDWAELNSSCKLQVRAAGKVKKPTGKHKDVALRGASSHELSAVHHDCLFHLRSPDNFQQL